MYAHPGSTDAYGGHVDWTTGEYHYHHGYSAHYHTSGVCPYDFVDNADHTNHGSSSSSSHNYNYGDRSEYVPATQYTLKPSPTPKTNISNISKQQPFAIANFVGGALLSLLIYGVTYSCFFLIVLVFETNLIPKISGISYETSRIDHFVCFSSAVGFVTTFDSDLFGVIFICFLIYTIRIAKTNRNNIKRKVAEEQEKKQIEFNKEKEKYTQLYGGKNILEIINAPPTAFVDDKGMPHQIVNKDDIFVIYLAPKQPRVFHRHKGCRKNLQKDNFVNLVYYNKMLTPCKKCCPPIPDTSWFSEYIKIAEIKKKYNIQ